MIIVIDTNRNVLVLLLYFFSIIGFEANAIFDISMMLLIFIKKGLFYFNLIRLGTF